MGDSQIIFLGTGSQSYVVGKQLRSSGGIIIKTDDTQLHIDPGPSALLMAKNCSINLRENTALLVSHNHLGHANDANAVISAMTYNGLDRKGILVSNLTAMNGTETIKPLISPFYRNLVEKAIVLAKEQKLGINDIEIIASNANHADPETIGFKIITDDFTLSYSSGSSYSAGLAEQYKGSDILILNVVSPSNKKIEDNLNSDDAVNIIQRAKPRLAIITHFGEKMLEENPLAQARDIQLRTKTQTLAATDCFNINPATYAAKTNQKKLNLYQQNNPPSN